MSEIDPSGNSGPDPNEGAGGKDSENKGSIAGKRINRVRSSGLLSFRNMAVLTILIVGGAVGYEVWKNPDLIGPSRLSRTPNVDDTPAGDQLRTSERYEDNLQKDKTRMARGWPKRVTSPLSQCLTRRCARSTCNHRPLPPIAIASCPRRIHRLKRHRLKQS